MNLAAKQFRRAQRERELFTATRPPAAHVDDPDLELRELLWSALRRLPYRQRAALVLRFYLDLPEREAARLLGCRVGTVKSLLHRGLAGMREEMGGERR